MQVILCEDVSNLGRSGDVVQARPGYVRNYLVPRGLAVVASNRNLSQLEHSKRVIAKREEKLLRDASVIKSKLESLSINIARKVGQEDKLFGSVTNKDIAEVLAERGVPIDRKKIQLVEPIRSLGVHSVPVQLARDISAELKVWVVAAEG